MQIAAVVIYQRDLHSAPLVEGNAPAMRGSGSTASRSARDDGFEGGLGDVMAVDAIQPRDVQADPAMGGQGLKEFRAPVRCQSCRSSATGSRHSTPDRSARQIQRRADQRVIHRQQKAAIAADALLVAQMP